MLIGSGWKKNKDGKSFMSCVMQSPFIPGGEISFAIFPVDEKKSDNAPDYAIVWSKPRPKTEGGAQGDDGIPF